MSKIIVIEPKKLPEVKEFKGGLKEMQGIVGGLIEVLPIGGGFLMVINEEGKLNGSEPNIVLPNKDVVFGTVFIACEKGEDIVGLDNKRLAYILDNIDKLPRAKGHENPDDYIKMEIITWN